MWRDADFSRHRRQRIRRIMVSGAEAEFFRELSGFGTRSVIMRRVAKNVTRRGFAGLAGAGALGALLRPGLANASQEHEGMSMSSQDDGEMTSDEMDAMHEAGIKAFPAETKGVGNQPLRYEMDGDVKVFRLTAQHVKAWEYTPGKTVEAMAYNGQIPGPEIRVTEGDKVRVHVRNELNVSTVVHWHGLYVPNTMDGVPFMTQPPIKPGKEFVYEFQVKEGNAGSHMYHSHLDSATQVTMGLLGTFIVEPKDPSTRPAFDREYSLVLNDGPIGGYSLNGKSFPATTPLKAKKGETILVRYFNEGLMIHPMHLHGMKQTVIAQDGYLLPQPYDCDTLNIAPGQRLEVLVHCTEVGTWAFHCHILSHAESNVGMFGMVTALIVEE